MFCEGHKWFKNVFFVFFVFVFILVFVLILFVCLFVFKSNLFFVKLIGSAVFGAFLKWIHVLDYRNC